MDLRATTLAMFVASALCVDAAAAADLLEVYERARMRDPQFLEAARVLAQEAWRTPVAQGDAARLAGVFRRVLGRAPSARELDVLQRLLGEQRAVFAAKPESAQQYLKVGEVPPDASLPPAELAAATVVVSTLMNHDEFVMKR